MKATLILILGILALAYVGSLMQPPVCTVSKAEREHYLKWEKGYYAYKDTIAKEYCHTWLNTGNAMECQSNNSWNGYLLPL